MSGTVFEKILDHLHLFAFRAAQLNKLNLTDKANFAEDVFGKILSITLSCNLKNANEETANVSAIDLKDAEKRIAVQVTTLNQKFAEKKKSTKDNFLAEAAYNDYNELVILYIANKEFDRGVLKTETIREGCVYTGFDIAGLLGKIRNLDTHDQNEILAILEEEYGTLQYKKRTSFVTDKELSVLRSIQPKNQNNLTVDQSETVFALYKHTQERHCLITGKPGIGKSFTINEFNSYCWEQGDVCITIPINDLDKATDEDIAELLGCDEYEWDNFLGAVEKTTQCFLIFDGYDTAKSDLLRDNVTALIKRAEKNLPDNWRILVSVREYEAHYSQRLKDILQINSNATKRSKIFEVPLLDGKKIEESLEKLPKANSVYGQCTKALRDLIRIPYFLTIFVDVINEGPDDKLSLLDAIVTEEQLLDIYWYNRITSSNRVTAKEKNLLLITLEMFAKQRLNLYKSDIIGNLDPDAFDELLKDGVLILAGVSKREVQFSHNILFDYALAVMVLKDDQQSFIATIEADEKNPFIFRSGYWYLLSKLWSQDIDLFWDLYFFVERQSKPVFKVIIQLLFNSVVAVHFKNIDEIKPLIDNKHHVNYGKLINGLLRSMRFATGINATDKNVALVENLTDSMQDEYLSIVGEFIENMIEQDGSHLPVVAKSHIRYLNYILDQRILRSINRNILDWNASRFAVSVLGKVIKVFPDDVKSVVNKIFEILKERDFSTDYFTRLADQVELIAATDQELAATIFKTLYLYNDASPGKMTRGGTALVSLQMSRHQEWGIIRHRLEEIFPNLLNAYPEMAIRLGLQIANESKSDYLTIRTKHEVLVINGVNYTFVPDGSVDYWDDEYLDGAPKLLKDIFHYIQHNLSTNDLDKVLATVYSYAKKGIVWQAILIFIAKNIEHTKQQAISLLKNDALLFSYETATQAEGIVRALGRNGSDSAKAEMEAVLRAKEHTPFISSADHRRYLIEHLVSLLYQTANTANIKESDDQTEQKGEVDEKLTNQNSMLAELEEFNKSNVEITQDRATRIWEIAYGAYKQEPGNTIDFSDRYERSAVMRAVAKLASPDCTLAEDAKLGIASFCVNIIETNSPKTYDAGTQGGFSFTYTEGSRGDATKALGQLYKSKVAIPDIKLIEKIVGDNDRFVRLQGVVHLGIIASSHSQEFWELIEARVKIEADQKVLITIVTILTNIDLITHENESFRKVIHLLASKLQGLKGNQEFAKCYCKLLLLLVKHSDSNTAKNIISSYLTNEDFSLQLILIIHAWLNNIHRNNEDATKFAIYIQNLCRDIIAENLKLVQPDRDNKAQWQIVDRLVMRMFFHLKNDDKSEETGDPKMYFFLKPVIDCLIEKSYDTMTGIMVAHTGYYLLQGVEKFIRYDPDYILALTSKVVDLGIQTGFTYDATTTNLVLNFVEIYMADHRSVILNSEHFTAILSILYHFVDAGWPEAFALVWKLNEMR